MNTTSIVRRGKRPAAAEARPSAGPVLSRPASRLLTALGRVDTAAIPDPTADGCVVIREASAGMSLGRGSHPRVALDELASAGLVARDPSGTARPSFTVTAAGRARLLRERPDAGVEPFRAQHLEVRIADGRDGPAVNTAESPLDCLRRRRDRDGRPFIDAASFEAGERLRRDLTLGGMLPSITARWEGAVSGGGGLRDPAAATDATIAARQRVRRALDAIGSDFADLLLDLCGFLKGLEELERDRGWPARSGKVVVRLALARLAAHYGLASEARGGPARIRVWSEPDASSSTA